MDIAIRALTVLWMILLPVVVGLWLARRWKTGLGLWGVGAATFVASQVLHLPFNEWVLGPMIQRWGVEGSVALVASLYGLSAGVFEEGMRYLVYRFWVKEARTWRQGVLFGAGHGGIEAILLGALAALALAQLAALRDLDLSTIVQPEQLAAAEQQVAAYWALPWTLAILPAVERTLALCFQIALAVMVLQAFVRRNLFWLLAAVAWHALVDAAAVYGLVTWGAVAAEALVAVGALASLVLLLLLRRSEGPPAMIVSAEPVTLRPVEQEVGRMEPTPDRLDDTRYT